LKTTLTSTKDNTLLGRREIRFEIQEKSTPSRAQVRRELAVLLKAELDQVWVRSIETKTGTHSTVGLAHVYSDPGKALVVEPGYIIQRNQKPEKAPEVEASEAEEPPVEEEEAPEGEKPPVEEKETAEPEAEEPQVDEEEAEEKNA